MKNDHGVYTIDFQDFEEKIVQHRVKVLLLCSPHNPVGRVWKHEELKQLVEICNRHNVFIISDEIHQDIVMPGHKHISILEISEEKDNIAMLTSAAKSFNLAGLKNAFMVIPGKALRDKIDMMQNLIATRAGNSLGYIAVAAAYTGGHSWLELLRAQVYENYTYAATQLKLALPNLEISPLEGTYLMWINFGAYLKHGDNLHQMLVDRCNLVLNEGQAFGGEAYSTFARLNLATKKENIVDAVERIINHLL